MKTTVLGVITLIVIMLSGCGTILTAAGSYAIDQSCQPSDMEKLRYLAGNPDNVVKIDNKGSEVWEYYNSPVSGKVTMYAFLLGKVKGTGKRDLEQYRKLFGEKSTDNAFLRQKFIDTYPVYKAFRKEVIAKSDEELPSQTGSTTKTSIPSSFGGLTTSFK